MGLCPCYVASTGSQSSPCQHPEFPLLFRLSNSLETLALIEQLLVLSGQAWRQRSPVQQKLLSQAYEATQITH